MTLVGRGWEVELMRRREERREVCGERLREGGVTVG